MPSIPSRFRAFLTAFPPNTAVGYILGIASLVVMILALLVVTRVLAHETWSCVVALLGLVLAGVAVVVIILRLGRLGVDAGRGRSGKMRHYLELALASTAAVGYLPLGAFTLIYLIFHASDLLHPFNYASLVALMLGHVIVAHVVVAIGILNFPAQANAVKRTLGDAAILQRLDEGQTQEDEIQ